MEVIKKIIYYGVDYKYVAFIVSAIFTALFLFTIDGNAAIRIIKLILASSASVGFTLFGFAVTALSILSTLKYTPFLQKVESNNGNIFRKMTDYFVYAALFLAVYGMVGLLISPDLLPKRVTGHIFQTNDIQTIVLSAISIYIPSISIILSVNCLLILRLMILGNEDGRFEGQQG